MSCEFCKQYDFTSVAIKDNNIHLAGGNTNFVECARVYPDSIKLFKFCPICGSDLLYEAPEEPTYKRSKDVVRVAVDTYGNRVDYAVFDDDAVLSVEAYDTINCLRYDTGCSFQVCKDAYNYSMKHDGSYGMMVAYCKAMLFAIKANVPLNTCIKRL